LSAAFEAPPCCLGLAHDGWQSTIGHIVGWLARYRLTGGRSQEIES
jgi:hypothetical protein